MQLDRRQVVQGGIGLLAVPLIGLSASAAWPRVGKVAPESTMTLVDRTKVMLSSLRGNVVVINFWATWCVLCRAELPLLDEYYREQQHLGLQVFAATTEDSVPLYRLKALFEAMAIKPLRNITGPYAPIDNAVPSNFIVDRDGVVRYARAGAFTADTLNEQLAPLLQQPGGTR